MKNLLLYAKKWYSSDKVAETIAEDCVDREGMAIMYNNKVRRPVYLGEGGNIIHLSREGAISFHRSVEKFLDPDFTTVESYDIIIDIDFKEEQVPLNKQLEAVVTISKEIIDFLYQFGFSESEIGIKYSGHHGVHLRLTTEGFVDEKIFNIPIKEAYPLFARVVINFIDNIVQQIKAMYNKEIFNAVSIDVQVASPRHMIRTVLSINEKAKAVSFPLNYESLLKLPYEYNKYKFPNVFNEDFSDGVWTEIKTSSRLADLIRLSSIWELLEEATVSYLRSHEYKEIIKKLRKEKYNKIKISPEEEEKILFPPCIRNMLEGMEDGRKRAVFILINFLANIGWDWERIEKKLWEWNEKNKEPLKERYIEYQLEWHKRVYSQGKKYLPPNCANEIYYPDMVSIKGPVCNPDNLCKIIKNPLVYYLKRLRMLKKNNEEELEKPKDLID